MRDRGLHDGLRDFALEVAALLSEEVKNGAEVPFVIEERGTRPVLYHYSPLTAEFLALRWSALFELPSYAVAARGLESRAGTYLRLRGLPGASPEPALRDFLERLYDESSTFEFPEERFEELYAELEDMLAQTTVRATVVVPVHGVTTESRRVELEDGLALLRTSELPALPDGLTAAGEAAQPGVEARTTVLCSFDSDVASDAPLPLAEALARFRQLLSALRLAGSGGAALSAVAWARAGEGPWQAVPLSFGTERGGDPWRLARDDEAELRELLGLLAGSHPRGAVAWALERFEMGCERAVEFQALTDHLLGLRALLGDDQGTGVPLRVAALCATAGERQAVQRRVEAAIGLERSMIAGDAVLPEARGDLATEVEGYLRALLRDLLCGYLDPDLRTVADDVLLAADGWHADARHEIIARDTRAAGAGDAIDAGAPEADKVEPDATEADTRELEAVDVGDLEDAERDIEGPRVAQAVPPEAAVTPSADWGFDEDAESYSAPV